MRKGIGRGKGRLNKTTITVKQAMNDVAAEIGYDGKGLNGRAGYLRRLAETNPDLFAHHWLRATVAAAREDDPANAPALRDVVLAPIAAGTYLPLQSSTLAPCGPNPSSCCFLIASSQRKNFRLTLKSKKNKFRLSVVSF